MSNEESVAIMKLNKAFFAVRGGLSTGHWSPREAVIVGQRLQAEVAGQLIETTTLEGWRRTYGNGIGLISVQEYFVRATQDPDHDLRAYKNDPLVTGEGLEV
jgi:hypothetical protein